MSKIKLYLVLILVFTNYNFEIIDKNHKQNNKKDVNKIENLDTNNNKIDCFSDSLKKIVKKKLEGSGYSKNARFCITPSKENNCIGLFYASFDVTGFSQSIPLIKTKNHLYIYGRASSKKKRNMMIKDIENELLEYYDSTKTKEIISIFFDGVRFIHWDPVR